MTTNSSTIREEIKTLVDTVTGLYPGYLRRPASLDNQAVPTYYIRRGEMSTAEVQTFGQSQKLIDFEVRLIFDLAPLNATDVNTLDPIIDAVMQKLEWRGENLGGSVEQIKPDSFESEGERIEDFGNRTVLVYPIRFTVQTRDTVT